MVQGPNKIPQTKSLVKKKIPFPVVTINAKIIFLPPFTAQFIPKKAALPPESCLHIFLS